MTATRASQMHVLARNAPSAMSLCVRKPGTQPGHQSVKMVCWTGYCTTAYDRLLMLLCCLHRITDTVHVVNEAHDEGKRILIEGANATMLDLDFGTYPYVTSSNPSIGGVISGLGLAPQKLQTVIGVVRHPTSEQCCSAGQASR